MNIKSCSGGFIVKDDKFLFGKRVKLKSWYAGVWDIFGGHAVEGEDSLKTLKRELSEELGIVPTEYELFTTVNIFDTGLQQSTKYNIYFVTSWKGKLHNCSDEHSEINWFTISELEKIQLAAPQYLDLIHAWKEK